MEKGKVCHIENEGFPQIGNETMKYLIIGNGVAGTEAALTIRKNDPVGEITIISESEHLFYYRPKLIDYLAGEITIDKLTIYQKEFYDKRNIQNILGTRVEKIVPKDKITVSEDGTKHEYDKLLLATGASCFIPPIQGTDKPGVFSLRGIKDADDIRAYSRDITNVAVIGGGLLGLETAYSLRKLGKKVTVIEVYGRLLPRQLDDEGAAILRKILEDKGLSFILPGVVQAIEGNGKVENVTLRSGVPVKTDMVLICAGIRGRDELAKDIGATVRKGIVVNDYLQTSIEHIYCAGDPAEHHGRLYGLWPPAKEQGMITGLNMAGVPTPYRGTVCSSTLKITGIDVYSAGDIEADDAEILFSKDKGVYRKLLLKNEKAIGTIVVGDSKAVIMASRMFAGETVSEEFKKYFQGRVG